MASLAAHPVGLGTMGGSNMGDRLDEVQLTNDGAMPVPNPLTDGRVFVKQGQNRCFRVDPPVVHFAGFTPGRTHSQIIKIKNISSRSQRVAILDPTTSQFSIRMSKLGLVAPGMCEEVTIEFTPDDLRYYYDCLRLHSEGENLAVPCHGYPVANDVRIPRSVDFGSVPINQEMRKSIEISCQTPLNFEYECTVVEPHSEIELAALTGIVPAMGVAGIELIYRPTTYRTSMMRFKFKLSQFGFEPVMVTVRGNCIPGQLKEVALSATRGGEMFMAEQLGLTRESFGQAGQAGLTQTLNAFGKAGQTTGSIGNMSSNYFSADQGADLANTGGGGGARNDLVSSYRASQQRLERSQRLSDHGAGVLSTKMPNFRPPTPDQTVEGIRFPPNVLTHAAVANVLTQEPGKLKIRDLKKAIDEAKEKAEADAAQLAAATGDGIAAAQPTSGGVGRQLVETIFEGKYRDVEEFERSKEIKWFVSIGDENMTEEEIATAQNNYRARVEQEKEEKELVDRQRKRTELLSERATFPWAEPPPPPEEGQPDPPPVHSSGMVPVWPESTGQETVRRFGLERFVDAARVVIIKNRADGRLAKLRALFERVGGTVEAIGELVDMWDDEEAMQGAMGGNEGDVDGDGRVDTMRLTVQTVERFAFPAYRESEFADRELIETMETIPDFEELDTFPLKVPKECELMGYRQWQTPIMPFDFPSSAAPEIRVGAQEESVIRHYCDTPEDLQQKAAGVEAAGAPVNLAVPVRPQAFVSADVYVPSQRYAEVRADYVLRPDALRTKSEGYGDEQVSKLGRHSVAVSENAGRLAGPLLSSAWRPSRGSSSVVTDAVGSRAAPPALMDGPDDSHASVSGTEDAAALLEQIGEDEFVVEIAKLTASGDTRSAREVASVQLGDSRWQVRAQLAQRLEGRVSALREKFPLLSI